MILDRVTQLTTLRRSHSAWILIASHRAPLVLGCFEALFEEQAEIPQEEVVQKLGDLFAEFRNVDEFQIRSGDVYALARQELREWLKKRLIIERNGLILATNALQKALFFIQELGEKNMTSTASRLQTVQNVIEQLEMQLNSNPQSHISFLEQKIQQLEEELERTKAGNIQPISEEQAVEGIKEVYQQGMSLKADFRRVEDSYREADRKLRKKIAQNNQPRSNVLDTLLDTNDELLSTPEGKVFNGFHEQLSEQTALSAMRQRLHKILKHPAAASALNPKQRNDLQLLTISLREESQRVVDARSQSENDVKNYIKTGLASENFKIGNLLNSLLDCASEIDWEEAAISKQNALLAPVGISTANLPVIQRLLCKEFAEKSDENLDLTIKTNERPQLDPDFWNSYNTLDREALYQKTITFLKRQNHTVSIAALHSLCPPEHDLEAISYWISLAREANLAFSEARETLIIQHADKRIAFDIPKVQLELEKIEQVERENLG